MPENQLKRFVKDEIERKVIQEFNRKGLSKDSKLKPPKIIDIRIAETVGEIHQSKRIGEITNQKQFKILKFLFEFDKENKIENDTKQRTSVNLKVLRQFIEDNLPKGSKERKAANKSLIEIIKLQKEIVKIQNALSDQGQSEKVDIKYAYLTFNTINNRQFALGYLYGTPTERCMYHLCSCCTCCFNKEKFLEKPSKKGKKPKRKYILADEAPDPSNIIWENIYTNDASKTIRRAISIFITLSLLVGTFIFIAYIREESKQVLLKYPQVICSKLEFTKATAIEEYGKTSDPNYLQVGFIECYCKSRF